MNDEFSKLKYADLIDVVVATGELIIRHFGAKNLDHKTKSDGSLLTIADLEANAFLVKNLQRLFPEMAILSEEHDAAQNLEALNSNKVFIIDPLDGTKSFANGSKEFAINLALKIGDKIELAIIHLPAFDTLYYADAQVGCYMINSASSTKNLVKLSEENSPLRDEIIIIATKRKDELEGLAQLFDRVTQKHKIINIASAMKFCMLCDGRADAYFRIVRLSIWDVVAGFFLAESCGFEVLNLAGENLLPLILQKDYLHEIAENQFRTEPFVIKHAGLSLKTI